MRIAVIYSRDEAASREVGPNRRNTRAKTAAHACRLAISPGKPSITCLPPMRL
jgi:hypothetical protein